MTDQVTQAKQLFMADFLTDKLFKPMFERNPFDTDAADDSQGDIVADALASTCGRQTAEILFPG